MPDTTNCAETGVCGLHGIEVERRRNTDKLAEHIPDLLSFKNRMIGLGVLGTVVIVASFGYTTGSFVYTYKLSNQYYADHKIYEAKIDSLEKSIAANERSLAVSNERYKSVMDQLKENNNKLGILIQQLPRRVVIEKSGEEG